MATGDAYRGYNSSKRRFFYGLKVHMVTTADGYPVEVSLTPGSYNDTKHLRTFELDFPEGSVLYGDKAYGRVFHRRPSGRGLRHRTSSAAEEKLNASGAGLRRIHPAGLQEENRNRIQLAEASTSRVDPRGYRPWIRTERLPVRARMQHRRTLVGRNLSSVTLVLMEIFLIYVVCAS